MAILKHIASKSSNYGAALEYLIFKHDEFRKTPILDQNGNRIMRNEFYLDGLNCEPYSFDAACQQLNREYQKNKNKDEIKSHHYIISFDPRDSTENCLTGKRAQELGLEYAKVNFPGHQALVCTHMDGHNGSGNIHVHIVINSLRKLDVPPQPFMERPIDCKAGYKHHVTNEYLKHLQKSLMDLCNREFLHQVDLLSPSRTGVTEAEYWAQRRLDEKKQEIDEKGFTPNPTKFQTQKQLIRDAVAAAREKAISYEDFQNILQDEYDIFVKTQRGRYSYLPPERSKFISERSLGESCKRECLEGFFVQNDKMRHPIPSRVPLVFLGTCFRWAVTLFLAHCQKRRKTKDQSCKTFRLNNSGLFVGACATAPFSFLFSGEGQSVTMTVHAWPFASQPTATPMVVSSPRTIL